MIEINHFYSIYKKCLLSNNQSKNYKKLGIKNEF